MTCAFVTQESSRTLLVWYCSTAYPGTSLEEATSVANDLSFVVNSKGGGGEKLVEGHDYLALPKGKVLEEAQKGAALIGD